MKKRFKVIHTVFFALIFTIGVGNVSAQTMEEDFVIMDSVDIFIDEILVDIEDPILNKEDFILLPMRALYESVGAKVIWNQHTQTASAIRNGKQLDLTVNSELALVDGESVSVDVAPFVYQDRTYVPLRFVSENLDGKVYWDNLARKVEISMDEPIQQTPPPSHRYSGNFIPKSFGRTPAPTPVPHVRLDGGRNLLVSDNPETLTQDHIKERYVTLAHQDVEIGSDVNQHRVFAWHHNKLGYRAMVGITIENTSDRHSLEVVSARGIAEVEDMRSIIYNVGLELADQALSDNFKNTKLENTTIRPGEIKTIAVYEVDNGKLIGLLHDLDIRSTSNEGEYTIRTVLSSSRYHVGKINSEQIEVDPNRQHPRGAWEHSTIVADLPEYTVGTEEVGYSFSNHKTDHLLTAETSLSPINGTVGNYGHYGVNYVVNIPIINPSSEEKTVKLRLSGRGGIYSGAVKMNDEVYLIPIIAAGREYVELPEVTISGASETITLEIMHAGASFLPLALYVEAEE